MRDADEKIARIIAQCEPDQYDETIAGMEKYAYFRHLSSLRSALLNWYPFGEDWDVLELRASFGALTGTIAAKVRSLDALEADPRRAEALRLRFRDRTNVHIRQEDALNFAPGKQYDCLVCLDAEPGLDEGSRAERERKMEALFARCGALLRPGGVLLTGYRNRFGIKYLCGGTTPEQPRAFSALQELENAMFSREQMNACLCRAGFIEDAYYYPMPDELFPQAVCTDAMPARTTLSDRLFTCDPFGSPMVAEEEKLYDDLLREGMLRTMANYYLAAFVKPPASESPARRVTYAALSADRGREQSCTTIIYSDGTVEKTALHPEGVSNLRAMRENLNNLAGRGIGVVPCEWKDRALSMPFVRNETLLDAIARFALEEPDQIFEIFDRLRDDILKSSDGAEVTPQIEEEWGIPAQRLGPVLERGYIDMIPLNAFRIEGGIQYYDQEFVVENCPASYILYRAILYTWRHVAGLESCIPREQMFQRYGLDAELRGAYARREQSFVDANRNHRLYGRFYRWAYRGTSMIGVNRGALRSRLERQMLLDEVHAVQLDLLKQFARACGQLGLRYFAVHGTLLGAARHQGFIPWDDDIDIAMPRADYEKLLANRRSLFAEPYFLQSFENDKSCFYGGYAKLRDNRTAAMEPRNRGKVCNQGIWIDILPIDRCPEGGAARRRLQRRITLLQQMLLAKVYPLRSEALDGVGEARLCALHLVTRVLRRRWIYRWLHRALTSVRGGDHLAILACCYGRGENKNIYAAGEIDETVELPFEDMMLPAPRMWREILIRRYGKDYERLPEEGKRKWDKGVEFDPRHSWKEKLRP